MPLGLSRKVGESLILGDKDEILAGNLTNAIEIRFTRIDRGRVNIAVLAPDKVYIARKELLAEEDRG